MAKCFNQRCDKEFDSVNDMVAVPGKMDMSPRHFCKDCASRLRRGPPV